MRGQLWIPSVLAIPVLATGCQSLFGESCASIGKAPAIAVRVTDAPMGNTPTSGVTLVIRGTAYDSVTTTSFGGGIQAGDRPGTYTVIVRQVGYREFSQSGVRVASASCNQPETARLDVTLQPL